jgi:hypothetical protein
MSLLNENLGDVDASMPLLAAGSYEFEIADCKEDTTTNGKPVLKLRLKLLSDAPAVDGKTTIHKGFNVFNMISLTPTDKYNPKKALKLLKLAAEGNGDGAFGAPASYNGKVVKAKIKVNPGGQNETTGQVYEPRNEVVAFLS